jgi:hypothetical protein
MEANVRHRRIRLLAAVGLGLLVACAQEASPEAGEPTLSISSPAEGDSVSGPVPLSVSVQGAEIGAHGSGKMHLHVYVDDSADYDVITSTETTVGVPDGTHTIRVVLSQPNHDETAISDSVRVTVAGAPPAVPPEEDTGGTGDTGGAGDAGDGYGGGYGY